MPTFKRGQSVRSKGALYIPTSGGYRRVHLAHIVRVYEDTTMGNLTLADVVTRYGQTTVNVSQLEAI